MENQKNNSVPTANVPQPPIQTAVPQSPRRNMVIKIISLIWVIGWGVVAGATMSIISNDSDLQDTLYVFLPMIFFVIQIVGLVFLLNMLGKGPSDRNKVFIRFLQIIASIISILWMFLISIYFQIESYFDPVSKGFYFFVPLFLPGVLLFLLIFTKKKFIWLSVTAILMVVVFVLLWINIMSNKGGPAADLGPLIRLLGQML